MLGVTVGVVVLAVVLLVTGTDAIRQYTAAKRADSGLPVQAVPNTPTAMFATVDDANQLTSVTMFVVDPSLAGGSIVSVPVNLDTTQGVGAERSSLRDAYANDGPTGLVQAVESLLSLSVDYVRRRRPGEGRRRPAPARLDAGRPAERRRRSGDGFGRRPCSTPEPTRSTRPRPCRC